MTSSIHARGPKGEISVKMMLKYRMLDMWQLYVSTLYSCILDKQTALQNKMEIFIEYNTKHITFPYFNMHHVNKCMNNTCTRTPDTIRTYLYIYKIDLMLSLLYLMYYWNKRVGMGMDHFSRGIEETYL